MEKAWLDDRVDRRGLISGVGTTSWVSLNGCALELAGSFASADSWSLATGTHLPHPSTSTLTDFVASFRPSTDGHHCS